MIWLNRINGSNKISSRTLICALLTNQNLVLQIPIMHFTLLISVLQKTLIHLHYSETILYYSEIVSTVIQLSDCVLLVFSVI